MSEFKEYFAFISYKREDEKWAQWLQRKLESFRLPSHLKGRDDLPKEIRPVFKDTSELVPGNLPQQIIDALDKSRFLIVICSPRSAASPWVDKEVDAFLKMGRADKIIPFIIEGIPFSNDASKECFPESLRALEKNQEILGANIREMGREAAFVKIVSRMFGLRFDVLWQRHERYLRRRRVLAFSLILLALLAATAFSVVLSRQNRRLKESNWEILRNESLMMAEKAERLTSEGDSFSAISLALNALPEDLELPERPYTFEAEVALRKALEGNALIQEGGTARSIAISPDGTMIASVSFDEEYGPLKIWDSGSGQFYLNPWRAPWPGEYSLNSVAFSPDGATLVTAGMLIQVWDICDLERPKQTASPSDSEISDLTFSPDGSRLAVASEDSLFILNTDSYRVSLSFPHPGGEVHSVAFGPDGNHLVSCSENKVVLWNIRDSSAEWTLKMKTEKAWTAVFSPDGKRIAIGMDGNTVRIVDANTGEQTNVLSTPSFSSDPVLSIAYDPNGDNIAFSAGKDIFLWSSQGKYRVFSGHDGEVKKVVFSGDGKRIVSASVDHTVRVWSVISERRERILNGSPKDIGMPAGKSKSIAFSPDGKSVIAGLGDRLVQWNAATGEKIRSYVGHSGAVTSFTLDPNGERLYSTSEDGSLRSWDTKTGLETGSPVQIDGLVAVGYSAMKRAVVTISEDGCVILWDPASLNKGTAIMRESFSGPESASSLSVSADGTFAIIGTEGGGYIMDLGTGDLDDGLFGAGAGWSYFVHSVAISPDGGQAATDAIIWDDPTTMRIGDYGGPLEIGTDRHITEVAFSPDGKRIVTGDESGLIGIFETDLGEEIVSYRGHKGTVTAVAFSPDGSQIASCSEDNTVCIWSYPSLQELIDAGRKAFDLP